MISWVCAFIDRPADQVEAAAQFWTSVLKWGVSPRRGAHDEFATLRPPDGDPYVKLQATADGHAGVHLDLGTTDTAALVAKAVGLGATVVAEHERHVVLASPAGQLFCAVRWQGELRRPRPTRSILGATSRLDQVCIDVAPARAAAETAFWAALTGWPAHQASATEFSVVQQPDDLPVRLLIQAVGEERPTGAHLDLACSDVTLVRAWHGKHGATIEAERPRWTVMRDPAGGVYCLTSRDPVTGRLP